jgi:hypothetical protein
MFPSRRGCQFGLGSGRNKSFRPRIFVQSTWVDLETFRTIFEARSAFQPLDCTLGSLFASVNSDEEFHVLVAFALLLEPKQPNDVAHVRMLSGTRIENKAFGRSNAIARATNQRAASDDNAAVSSGRDSDTTVSDSVGATVSSALQAANAASQAAASTAGVVQGVQTRGNALNIILPISGLHRIAETGR